MAGVWGYAANMTGLTLGGGGFVFQDFKQPIWPHPFSPLDLQSAMRERHPNMWGVMTYVITS